MNIALLNPRSFSFVNRALAPTIIPESLLSLTKRGKLARIINLILIRSPNEISRKVDEGASAFLCKHKVRFRLIKHSSRSYITLKEEGEEEERVRQFLREANSASFFLLTYVYYLFMIRFTVLPTFFHFFIPLPFLPYPLPNPTSIFATISNELLYRVRRVSPRWPIGTDVANNSGGQCNVVSLIDC